jgi:Asp-tRNA(Asn)/Glu-tRNA(Gln) amidotransferase A subunit family amidase
MPQTDEARRRFLAYFSAIGLSSTLLPGALWAQAQEAAAPQFTLEMLQHSLALAGLTFSGDDEKAMLNGLTQNLTRYQGIRAIKIPNDVSPPFYFSSITPGMKVNRTHSPLVFSAPAAKRPANIEDLAFASIVDLAQLLKTRKVTSLELTEMYLARLHKYNAKLNCVVTFLDDVARAQAKQADAEIAAGKYRGPLHGIPWGAKDIIAVKGYKTTWGSNVYKDQVIDEDASVVEMLREAGAVLLAKLTSGELAQGDQWFGGQTKNPWNTEQGSSGSSAGPASATAGGLVAFGIGTETSGSILSPSGRCGITGLRPTFGRVSRNGVMALSWTQDRLGPLCRYAEDCAIVMSAIAKPDGRDLSVSELPFNWNAHLDIRKLRVGYLKDAFDETRDPAAKAIDDKTLEQMQALGVKLIPLTTPDWTLDVSSYSVESAVFFEELIRTGRDKQLTNPSRGNGWRAARMIPAVEYLQAQRARSIMMMQLADATAAVDVYLAPANSGAGGGGGGRGAGRGGRGAATDGATTGSATTGSATTNAATTPPAAGRGRGGAGGAGNALRRSPMQRHFNMANMACYPALAVPNGFYESGAPASVTFMARPFGEAELIAVGKAYQDAAGFHLKHPTLTA